MKELTHTTPHSRLCTPNSFWIRILSLILAELFLSSSILPAWAGPSEFLRPKPAEKVTLFQGLRTKDGGEREIDEAIEQVYRVAQGMQKEEKEEFPDAPGFQEISKGEHHFYFLSAWPGDPRVLQLLRETVHTVLKQNPQKWIFVTLDPASETQRQFLTSPDTGIPEVYFLYEISKILKIPVEEMIVSKHERVVIAEAIKRGASGGITAEDIYQALLLDLFPVVGKEEGGFDLEGTTEEALRDLAEAWGVLPSYLLKLKNALLGRLMVEGVDKLDTLSDYLTLLSNDMTKDRLDYFLHSETYENYSHIFVLAGGTQTPPFLELLSARDGGRKASPFLRTFHPSLEKLLNFP